MPVYDIFKSVTDRPAPFVNPHCVINVVGTIIQGLIKKEKTVDNLADRAYNKIH